MKKVLSLVLAFAMILGSFGFVFASDFPDVSDTEYYSEPVNVLSGLGVIGGFPDGTFKPTGEVTRAQMATMIVNALGMTVTGKADTKFSDVPASHWASGFINYAASVGFIAGYPDGSFKPEQQVTYDQALTMIVAALGYKSEALTGDWPGNFVNMARGLGILDICKTTGTAKAPRQDIACFLYKALTSPIGYTDKDGAFQPNIGADGVKGHDNMLARLGANVRLGEDKKELFFVIEGTEDAKINLKNYMGAYASVYEDKDGDIVAIKEVKSEFIEGTLKSLKDDYKFDATKQAAKDIYKSFKNGDVDKEDVAYNTPTDSVKLAVKLSGKKVSEVYSMQVWTDGKTFQFGEDSAEAFDAKTPNINGSKFALTEDDEIDTAEFALNGVASLAEIKEDDIVTVYEGSDKTVARIDVSRETVTGIVSKINSKGDAYTVAGTAYGLDNFAVDPEGNELTNPKMKTLMDNETEATFFLTYAGDIYTYSVEEEGTENYAIFLEGGEDAGRYSGTSQYAKLFLADGTEKEFAVSIKESDGTNTYTKAELNTNFQGKLVKYTVNTKDQVTDLEVAPEEYTSLAATEKFDDNGVYKNEALKSTTVVFSLVGTDVKSADSYKVIKAEDLFGAHADDIYYFVTSGNYDAALVKGATTVDKTYAIFIESAGTTKDGVLWTALYDGAVETLTVENTTALIAKVEGAAYTTAAGVAAKLAVLTMSDDVVTDIDASKVGAAGGTATGKSTLSGDVLTANSKKYSLDENVKVYVLDDGDWAAAAKSTLAMSASSYEKMFLINADDDAAIEFVLVIK